MRKILLLLILLAAIGGAGTWYLRWSAKPEATFRTEPVKRGDLVVTISATGTVEPVEVIDVGAQVAGKIETFGKDADGKAVDYGTAVEQGMVLAHIDDALYAADVAQSTAQLESAKANVIRAQADLEQMRAKLVEAERNWKRAKDLGPSKALSATDYDSYQAAYETGKAVVAVGDAAVVQAQKGVAQAEAALKRVQTNHSYCTIRSPVKGVIVDRRVNIGQTVVASLNAPSLFLIAKDLTKLQVWASVNEMDIGRIYPGQPVRFTVEAYPEETFIGQVGKVRLNASMVQNVVNYTVEINTDNPGGKLLPYLTANVQFEVSRKRDVLLVPTTALRWNPSSPDFIQPEARAEMADRGAARKGMNKRDGGSKTHEKTSRDMVWVQDNGFVRPIKVKVGLNDGTATEVIADDVKEDMELVVGEVTRAEAEKITNPFAPQIFGGRGQRR